MINSQGWHTCLVVHRLIRLSNNFPSMKFGNCVGPVLGLCSGTVLGHDYKHMQLLSSIRIDGFLQWIVLIMFGHKSLYHLQHHTEWRFWWILHFDKCGFWRIWNPVLSLVWINLTRNPSISGIRRKPFESIYSTHPYKRSSPNQTCSAMLVHSKTSSIGSDVIIVSEGTCIRHKLCIKTVSIVF